MKVANSVASKGESSAAKRASDSADYSVALLVVMKGASKVGSKDMLTASCLVERKVANSANAWADKWGNQLVEKREAKSVDAMACS